METTINKREKVGSVAIQQALRSHFKLTIKKVAALKQVCNRTVWQNTNGNNHTVISWEDRTRKDEAILEAKKLMII